MRHPPAEKQRTGVWPRPGHKAGAWRDVTWFERPIAAYDPHRDPPVLYRTGDSIRFIPIVRAEYERIAREVAAGTYTITSREV